MKMLVNLFRNVIRQAFHRFEFFQGSLPDALHAAKKLQQHTLACIANSFDLIKLARVMAFLAQLAVKGYRKPCLLYTSRCV